MATKRARHYALISNIDLRMLRRQKARLYALIVNHPLSHNDRQALQGILHLLDAVEDKANVSSTSEDLAANDAEKEPTP